MALPEWVETALEVMRAGGLAMDIGQPLIGLPSLPDVPTFAGARAGTARVHPRVHEHQHRRRRRRALTASDRADIAFIAGLLGRPAGKDFAVIIGAKNR